MSSLGFPRSPDGRLIELTATDPLADRYQELLRKYGVEPPAWPVPLAVEELSKRFDDSVFDLVRVCNALDHPVNAIIGDKGGTLGLLCYLQHPNEAEGAAYTGLHGCNLGRAGRTVYDLAAALQKNRCWASPRQACRRFRVARFAMDLQLNQAPLTRLFRTHT